MFTGIVEELGTLTTRTDGPDSSVIEIAATTVTADVRHGDSITVNGVCLTVVEHGPGRFTADVMAETLDRSTLGRLTAGDPVNLERAMRADARFGGHIVQGHVDATTTVLSREPGERWDVVTLALPPQLRRYVVLKGSVTLDGVSLTVSARTADTFAVSLIPTTLELTTLGRRGPGEEVNVEVDVLAKYVESMLTEGVVPAGTQEGSR
ncbi:riboflavin synthase [Ornithinimicrobium cerasi]|uniref:Riboflavin synthase n=1 Tax=Ornithinimicrobium cerasi TaxID=2248773 RepID=A0A285VPL8_9MICO|nr:riboflavin synthase [Ornithinimicrobium cerasi]SOC55995.1 riboflavin synthase alpha chain [Ornithinimicrobium cerasi]